MRTLSAAFFVLLAVTAQAGAASNDAIMKAVEMWQPMAVNVTGNEATVILPQSQITDTIYKSVISSGLCFRQISEPDLLDGVQVIRILNKHSRQGYVFEGGKDLCAQLNEMPIGKGKELMILANTHLH